MRKYVYQRVILGKKGLLSLWKLCCQLLLFELVLNCFLENYYEMNFFCFDVDGKTVVCLMKKI